MQEVFSDCKLKVSVGFYAEIVTFAHGDKYLEVIRL